MHELKPAIDISNFTCFSKNQTKFKELVDQLAGLHLIKCIVLLTCVKELAGNPWAKSYVVTGGVMSAMIDPITKEFYRWCVG